MTGAEKQKNLSTEEKFSKLKQMRRAHLKNYYHMAEHARDYGKLLAWSCASGISELINAMDIVTFRPASYCAVASARGMASDFADVAASSGYSPDLCSYCRVSIGMMIAERAPFGAMPKPDLLVNDATLCDCDNKGWEPFALQYKVPFYFLEGPMRFSDDLPPHFVKWKADEIRQCGKFIEKHTGRKFDMDRFKETMMTAIRTRELFTELEELRKLTPSPVDHNELFNAVHYQANAPGKQTSVDYLDLFLEIAKENAAKGIGAVPDERFRIFFDGITIWHDLKLYQYLKDLGIAIVWDTYTNLEFMPQYFYGLPDDPDKPFESLAMKYLYSINNLSIRLNMLAVKRAVTEWKCNGAIIYNNKSCKPYSTGNSIKAKMLVESGIPTLVLDVDHTDPGGYSPEDARNQVEVFLEMMEEKKK